MNVAICTIADDLGTTITGVQTTITLFTLVMAALMMPGSKLTSAPPGGPLSPGIAVLALFAWHIRRTPEPLCEPKLSGDRTSNLGLSTQLVQWLVPQGAFSVLSAHLQQVEGLSAVETGLALLPAAIGMLVPGRRAGRLDR